MSRKVRWPVMGIVLSIDTTEQKLSLVTAKTDYLVTAKANYWILVHPPSTFRSLFDRTCNPSPETPALIPKIFSGSHSIPTSSAAAAS
jgi:hypothetical protein